LQGATITLSNFGVFAGRYASPIIVPPQVAIIGAGKIYSSVTLDAGTLSATRMLPLSLSFDHRAATGGEASRFLGLMLEDLIKIS
jgi:2-oxoisovalerate dehydrogenase E2 component (dihydrolipoyl transacylase)